MMKRFFWWLLLVALLLIGCAKVQDKDSQSSEEPNEFMQPVLELEGYNRLGNLIYSKSGKYYSLRNNQLSEIKITRFESSIMYKNETYDIQFEWCIIDEKVYVFMDEEVEGFLVENIEDCHSAVLLHKYIRLEGIEASFLCDLEENTISLLVDKDSINCDSIESVKVSSNLVNMIINADKQTKSFYFDGTKFMDVSDMCGVKTYEGIDSVFVEDKVLASCIEILNNDSYTPVISCYVYDSIDETVVQTVKEMPLYLQNSQERGLILYGNRYGTFYSTDGFLGIYDMLMSTSMITELQITNVAQIQDMGERFFAVVLNTGQIALLQKADGEIIKITEERIEFTLGVNLFIRDSHLYVEEIVEGIVYIYGLTIPEMLSEENKC